MKAAFEEMRNQGEDNLSQTKNNSKSKLNQTIKNTSNLSESDETIQSINLGGSKTSKLSQNSMIQSRNPVE